MLTFISEAGFVDEEIYTDQARRDDWIRSLLETAKAHASKEGWILRGAPSVTFSELPGRNQQREALILCVFEKPAELLSNSAD